MARLRSWRCAARIIWMSCRSAAERICWKRYVDGRVNRFDGLGIHYLDVSAEIRQGEWGKALQKAVRGTLYFLEETYGARFDRLGVDDRLRNVVDWRGPPLAGSWLGVRPRRPCGE